MLDTSYEKAITDIKRGCATLMSHFRKLRDFEKFNYEKDTHDAIIARLEKFAHLMKLLSDYDSIDFEEDGIVDTPRTREFYKKLKATVESLQNNEDFKNPKTFQKGDDVKVFGRPGKVVKVRGDVVDIEFPADDQNMARSDSYYKQDVQKV